ncbi:NUDIX hydrolase [Microvirga lotononidis]|uniref:NTP pyrophosphohydrolase n=1 Tax=Microvirga lotononidis TaxID=864069 RepID=I4YZ65_9HYPH|nr:NUDIX hydrolase [Microvirga lotononidis]EIM29257.1 NTP pyrophosphohydrolase [Microvirga lotononidis]WQO29088.1 NUDIX hydrolase [Microvirga lotononidis]
MTTGPDPSSTDLKPWTVSRSRDVIRDRWVTLRADDCVTAEGVEIAPYYVLEYPDWVHVIAIDDEDHLVLIEQYRHAFGGLSLEVPAGAIDREDPSVLAAAARELEEETGYVAERWRSLGKHSPNPATHTNSCHTVLALGARPVGRKLNDPTEQIKVVRVPVGDAARLAADGTLTNAMQIASLAIALGAIGKWHL